MPPDLRQKLEASAEREGRSLNAEIVRRLEESFEHEKALRRQGDIAVGAIDSERSFATREMDYATALEEKLRKLHAQVDTMTQNSNEMAKRLAELERASTKSRK